MHKLDLAYNLIPYEVTLGLKKYFENLNFLNNWINTKMIKFDAFPYKTILYIYT